MHRQYSLYSLAWTGWPRPLYLRNGIVEKEAGSTLGDQAQQKVEICLAGKKNKQK